MLIDAYNPNSNSFEGLYSRRTLLSCNLVLCIGATKENKP
jgi:hypothetical protein